MPRPYPSPTPGEIFITEIYQVSISPIDRVQPSNAREDYHPKIPNQLLAVTFPSRTTTSGKDRSSPPALDSALRYH